MSDQQNNEQKNEKYRQLGKVKNINTKNGTIQKIYMDNLSPTNQDGTPNQYYQGALIWCDAKTGKQFHVKQMQVYVPPKGMPQALVQKGFSHFITLNVEDTYDVTPLT